MRSSLVIPPLLSFFLQIITEYLLHAASLRHFARHQGYSGEQKTQCLLFLEVQITTAVSVQSLEPDGLSSSLTSRTY